MFSQLKNHPFAIKAKFDYSVVLSFAIPKKEVEHLIPDFLKLDLWQGEFAFFTLAFVKVNKLRPKGLPSFMGQNFYLVGHRFFVQYVTQERKRLRGLYILKSQTDRKQMTILGNALTHYKYELINIKSAVKENSIEIYKGAYETIKVQRGNSDSDLPENSVFNTWKEARRFAGPLPFTFSALKNKKVLIVEGKRANWTPVPLKVEELNLDFSEYPFMRYAILSNAFIVENIPYEWKKGKVEEW